MPKGKPRSMSSEVPLDADEHFIKLLETVLKSEKNHQIIMSKTCYSYGSPARQRRTKKPNERKRCELENNVDDLEQYTRIDDLIIKNSMFWYIGGGRILIVCRAHWWWKDHHIM